VRFLPLVWSGVWRKPARTLLTAGGVAVAFLLLGLLQGVNAGFARAIADAHREYLVTGTRVRGGAPMPISAISRIRALPGVVEVAPRAYFLGNYKDPGLRNAVAAIATEPDAFFRLRPGIVVDRENLDAMRGNRKGMLATPALLEWLGRKVGDAIVLRSQMPKTDGTRDWTFNIVGTFDTPKSPTPAAFGIIHYDYLDESRVENRGTAEIFYVRIADPTKAVAMAAAIDAIFANSPHETRTRSDQARAELQAKQMGDVGFFTNAIMSAALFALAFLTGNTLQQALRERMREFAVLRATGYSTGHILVLAYTEALLLILPPAGFGLLLARLAAPFAREDIGSIVVSPAVAGAGLLCAVALAFAGAALPTWKLARAPIAAALNER
jgi:putative ABC transport system permease protein